MITNLLEFFFNITQWIIWTTDKDTDDESNPKKDK